MPVVAEVERFDPPADLAADVREYWNDLAPFAFANRTLTKATAAGFLLLCRNLVIERALGKRKKDRGGANHRGMIQRVDAELLRFNLAPCGKPMYEAVPETQVNPLARFLKNT